MNMLKSLSLLVFFVLGLTLASAQDSQADVAITLSRTACFGTCPVYTISILKDGTVLYNGQEHVAVTGEQTYQIEPTLVDAMVKGFEEAGYFDWDAAYDTQTVTDMPTVTMSVTRDGETHTIVHYAGDFSAPLALQYLEWWVDQMAGTQMWTGVQPDLSATSNGNGTPLVTLQRGPCFGLCPIYGIAAFDDGTVVYVGIANVDKLGVQIFNVEPAAVTSVAERANIFGYFKWKDSYEEFMMTDQATVITTVRWEDQFKKIVRYEGDLNAPIGVVRVEEIIDLLVPAPDAE